VAARKKSDLPDETAAVDFEEMRQLVKTIAATLGVLALRSSSVRTKSDSEKIRFLKGLGFDRHGIAAILTTTAATVSTRLSEGRKSGKRSKSQRRSRA
jgi:hypothetical protein